MSYRPTRSFSLLVLIVLLSATSASAQKIPAWLTQAASMPTPTYEIKGVPAVVLLNEETVNVSSDGTFVRTVRRAVRILEPEGKPEAVARVIYQTDADKVKDLGAWLIRQRGKNIEYGKKETLDVALVSNDLYNEARSRVISARNDAEPGDVFGYESVLEERNIFSQFSYRFQYDIPVLRSRFALNMPVGWRAESVTFNAQQVEPATQGTNYVWEMANLLPIRYEPGSPRRSSLAPRLAVSIFPEQAVATRLKTFSSWNEVARWMSEIEDPQMTINDDLAAKAQELTANAKTEFEKIQAISRYVQGIQYISIQIGTGRGGGYIPRPSTEVFARSYGDCKDKANLMRAMLHVLGIESYLVSITADDPHYVRAEWASPHQFNHCIIAVKISDGTVVESVVTHPALGRLLIFDPTDPYTPIGDLPEDQQGSLALIDHPETQGLTVMPILPPNMNRVDRHIEVELSPEGAVKGTVIEKNVGQAARQERARMKELSSTDYNRVIERWISRGATGARTSKISPSDDHEQGKFDLEVEFTANSYAQLMQQRLMVFRPAIIGRLDRLSFGDGKRMNPYSIDASAYTERVRIKLPEGFEIDEMPETVALKSDFGTYDVNYEIDGAHLIFTRSLTLNRTTVPADKYESVKTFFGKVHGAEQAPVVLLRK